MSIAEILLLSADRVYALQIDMIVPQHGAPLRGAAVGAFMAWARELRCGIVLMGPLNITVPT